MAALSAVCLEAATRLERCRLIEQTSNAVNASVSDFLQAVGALAALGFFLLPIGLLAEQVTHRLETAHRTAEERLLWAVALGVPLGVLGCVLAGRLFPSRGVVLGFSVCAAAALLVGWTEHWPAFLNGRRIPRTTVAMLALMALFALYCLLETLDITLGQRVYVSTLLPDWSVRVAMVKAAMRSGVPPLNGLSTVSAAGLGRAPALRYYYFWYVAVAQAARSLGLRAQPALAASCIWAGWGLIASAFLALKYMLGERAALRSKCFALLGVGAVLGLDILPTAWLWLSAHHHPYLEMEWWRQDRTPSFLGAVLASPHHIGAFCALVIGFLVLLRRAQMRWNAGATGARHPSWLPDLWAALLAGGLFASAAGMSLFPTFCFVFVLAFWAVDLARRRDGRTVLLLASSGLIALGLAHGYLRELTAGSSAASGFVNLAWRNDAFVADQLGAHAVARFAPWLRGLVRQPMVLVLHFFELGFYSLVLVVALRQGWRTKGRLDVGRCAWYALLLGAGVPMLFLTSRATSGPNDLGFDAGFLVRFALQLWAAGCIWDRWQERRRVPGKSWRAIETAAVVLAGLGLLAQGYQVLSIRLYFPVVGSGRAHKQMDVLTEDHLAERLGNVRTALTLFDREVPASAPDTEAVQFNPVGVMLPAEVYFSDHQIASWDTGCGTSYGGDYRACAPVFSSLLFLYGNTLAGVVRGRAQNDRQDGAAGRVATADDLAAVCRQLRLRAVVAESTDSIWAKPHSWVWTAPVMVALPTVRVVSCPAGSWRP